MTKAIRFENCPIVRHEQSIFHFYGAPCSEQRVNGFVSFMLHDFGLCEAGSQ